MPLQKLLTLVTEKEEWVGKKNKWFENGTFGYQKGHHSAATICKIHSNKGVCGIVAIKCFQFCIHFYIW